MKKVKLGFNRLLQIQKEYINQLTKYKGINKIKEPYYRFPVSYIDRIAISQEKH